MTGTPIAEAARELRVPRSTVREWATAGRFHQHRDGSVSKRGMDDLRRLAEERIAGEENDEEKGNLRDQLLRAQVRERRAIGRLRELELEHEKGRFVELAMVRRDGEDTAERVISILRAIPQRTALALECSCQRAAVVEQRISVEVERAIAEMKDSTYIRPRSKK